MKRITILLFLAGCGPSGEDVMKVLEQCDSPIEMTIYKNTWADGIELTCTVNSAQPDQNDD